MESYSIYISDELATKAKEKGCPIPYETELYTHCEPWSGIPEYVELQTDRLIPVTAEQLCGWLRTCKDIQVSIGETFNSDYKYKCVAYKESDRDYSKVALSNYYEIALLDGLNQALDLI